MFVKLVQKLITTYHLPKSLSRLPKYKRYVSLLQERNLWTRGSVESNSSQKSGINRKMLVFGTAVLGVAILYQQYGHTNKIFAAAQEATTTLKKKADLKEPKRSFPEEAYPEEKATITMAPQVPPPITRKYPVKLLVDMEVVVKELPLDDSYTYEYWTFNNGVPGPMIRARVGDIMQIKLLNKDTSGMLHNLDFHAVLGPGGGAPLLNCGQNEVKEAQFKLKYPGLFIYHCAVDPVSVHISNGMFGLILVEPETGMEPVEREYYLVQSEVYTEEEPISHDSRCLPQSIENLMKEQPNYIVFNGKVGSHLENNPFISQVGEKVRFYVGNPGPNLVSSFHIIGTIFDKVWRDGSMLNDCSRGLQTILIPSGSSAIVELETPVPGTFTLVDHSISRIEKGCVAFLQVNGEIKDRTLYCSNEGPNPCPGCKIHP